ncbi:transmembrane domain-containing protein [Cryptosporidium canis]|uniref:Transmembrane domain-containing protein n=1 Tax=Cryptosporidium canis TaxID=195482 RepID=A0ABQ8P2D1_9CRYT|nr:transmembrane domain-containing protein [Cryptosporidium canis]
MSDKSGSVRLKRRANVLLESLFSSDGISQVYLVIVIILIVNLGVGLYFCGRNVSRESELLSSSIFDINVNIPKGNKDKNANSSNYIPRNETQTQGRPDHPVTSLTTAATTTLKTDMAASSIQAPALNSLPTCLYSSKFPAKYDLNGLLFWNVSSDAYLYWGYKNKTGSIYLLGSDSHLGKALQLVDEVRGRSASSSSGQPQIMEFRESRARSGQAGVSSVIAVGERALPPYWYMNWVEQTAAKYRERFKPAFQPCLGSLFTYSSKDLQGFFQDQGVIYMCGFSGYTVERDLIELTSTPFIRLDTGGDKYLSVVESRSKNRIYRLAIMRCRDKQGGYSMVVTYSSSLSRSVEEADCGPSSDSWLMFRSGGSLFSAESGAGDWKMRRESGKFESLKETGKVKKEPCFSSWWSTYGGVKSKQFVPST